MSDVVLVCGGRDYTNRSAVFSVLDRLHAKRPISAIRHGCAKGADTLAGEWARARGVPEERYPADWDSLGRRAGPARNLQMLAAGGLRGVVAFPGGAGTAHMAGAAHAAGVPVWVPVMPHRGMAHG